MAIRIDDLDATVLPSREHEVPAMKDGITVKLTVGQVLDLLIDSAPGALDTLDELAAALGDDENFSATVTAALAERVKRDGSIAWTGDMQAGGFKITGLGDGSNPQDAATIAQVVRVDDAQSLSAAQQAQGIANLATRYEFSALATALDIVDLGDAIAVRLIGSVMASNDAVPLLMRLSDDNGATFEIGASDYEYYLTNNGTSSGPTTSSSARICTNIGNASGEKLTFDILLTDFNAARRTDIMWKGVFRPDSGGLTKVEGVAQRLANTAHNALQLFVSAGTITGYVDVFPIKG